jgi:hypothetical protein
MVILAVLGQATVAWAGSEEPTAEDIRQAAQEFSEGQHSYRAHNFAESAEHFEAADGSAPSTNALRGAISSRQKAGQADRAATLAALALERHPDDAELREYASKVIEEEKSKLHRVQVSCNFPCELVINTSLVHGSAAESRVIFLLPGTHTVRASWNGFGAESEKVEATAGGESALKFQRPEKAKPEVTAPPAPAQPTPPPQAVTTPPSYAPTSELPRPTRARGWSPAVFWTGVGLTGVLGAVTVWSGIDTINNPGQERVREECVGLGSSCALYQEGQSKEKRTNILWVVTGVVGLATGITGLGWTDWSGRARTYGQQDSRRASGIRPYLKLGQSAELGATGRF